MSNTDSPDSEKKEGTDPIPLVGGGTKPTQPPRSRSNDETAIAAPKRKPKPPPPPKHEPGAKVERYIIEKLLGRGGMAEVYQAHDPKLKRKIALKLLHGDQKFYSQKKLFFEAQAAAHFEHPNSVIIYDVGETGDDTFIAMELIRGRRLSEFARDITVPLGRKLRWLVSIARALAAAHRKGLVHRDIKPANVMIRDEDGEAKVLDFGIARQVFPEGELEGDITETGQMVGTVRYAAPEQIRGETVDSRADQFSWGITAYQLLSGRMPFIEQDTMAVASRVAFEETPSLRAAAPELPDEVIATIDRAISKEPADRFPTMDEVADALDAFADGVPGLGRSSQLPSAPTINLTQLTSPTSATSATPGSQTPPLGSASPTDPAAGAIVGEPQRSSRRMWLLAAGGALALSAAGIALSRLKSSPPQAATPPPARVEVSALRYAPATMTGESDAEIARALGVAACARLGVEMGVPWGETNEAAPVVNTTVTFGPEVEAAVEVRGQRGTGRGSTPIQAVEQAVAALAATLAAPAMEDRDVRAWGATSEAGARRIERAWRKRGLWPNADGSGDARMLLETDADSPIAHLLTLMSPAAGKEALDSAKKAALSAAGRLPSARESMLKGVMSALPEETNRAEATRLLRIAYSEAPNDADIAALFTVFAVQWGLPEAYGALDRLTTAAPTRSRLALESALGSDPKRDLDRIDRYAAKMVEIFPEARATPGVIRALVTRGKLNGARAALAFARKLGLDKAPADPLVYVDSALWVELAAGDAAEARRLSLDILGDPRPHRQVLGGHGVASSHLLEGQASRAEAVLWENADRHRGVGNEAAAVAFAVRALGVRRMLKQPPVDLNRLDWVRAAVRPAAGTRSSVPLAMRVEGIVELTLAQTGVETFKTRTEGLKEVEALVNGLPAGDAMRRQEMQVKTVPLVRALQGDRLAIALWKGTAEAPFSARLKVALDVALAMDATGDLMGALAVYKLAEDPWNLREAMLERVLAMQRLSKMLPRIGRVADGLSYKEAFESLWQGAEPAARSALELIR